MTIQNYIGGVFTAPNSGKYLDNINPATGQVYSQIPDSDQTDVEQAVLAAKKAFKSWRETPVQKRSEILLKIATLIKENAEDLALCETIDNGKPLWLCKSVDIPRAAANFEFYATGIRHWASKAHLSDDKALNYTLHQPMGVAACISPWNLPLYLLTWKIAPALAVGNTVVAKPSEITPMTAYKLCEIAHKAGLPDGVLNVVHGLGPKVGEPLITHKDVPIISFTGGTSTGSRIATLVAPAFKKVSLELGGKNPNIIFADADLKRAVDTAVKASFSNQGQICLCGSRILIESSIYETFKTAFIENSKALKVGDPLDENSNLGAMVSEAHMNKVLSCIETAKQEGGKILLGGERVHLKGNNKDGFFIAPTIIEGLSNTCKTNQNEIFGPVVTLQPFDTEQEAVELANQSTYGLSASIFTENASRAHRVSAQIHAGIVWVNTWLYRDLRTPFGGYKQSGLGREGGFKAFAFFTETKNVCIKYS